MYVPSWQPGGELIPVTRQIIPLVQTVHTELQQEPLYLPTEHGEATLICTKAVKKPGTLPRHSVAPAAGPYLPVAQFVNALKPAFWQKVPGGQVMQLKELRAGAYVPGPQITEALMPLEGHILPRSHAMQLAIDDLPVTPLYVPFRHRMNAVCPLAGAVWVPTGAGRHAE
jgi:hypothetical protein